ncbi:MAG: hypothetical protein NVSMB9_16000 [Isosphaeraceae bacterium]
MSHEDWARFDAHVGSVMRQTQTPTQARANGRVISRLLDAADQARPVHGALDWMDWERQKTLRLLRSAV